ncbi:MAG: hypothetical protein H8E10_17155 [Desulfobacterales bacterium]|nr:hypothetical protein [Desulfobacterales bacterium]MBL7173868.1 hypothetical protein [Desulfobacteraceae bacterium]
MKQLRSFLLILLLACASGCASSPPKSQEMAVPKAVESSDLLIISDTFLDKKIGFLETIAAKEELPEEDRKAALKLLDTYKQLRKFPPENATEKESQELIRSLFESLDLMDERYFERKKAIPDYPGTITLFVRSKGEIIDLYLKGDFKGVIKRSFELKATFGPDALTPEIGLLFALSLAKEGRFEQAIQIGEGIAGELNRLPDIIQLRASIAQWQLALGKKDKALHTYERLTDYQDERAALIQDLDRKIRRAEKGASAEEPKLIAPKPGSEGVGLQGERTMDQLLKEVSSLIQEHAYGKARLLLLRERIKVEEGPESEILDRELTRVEQQEAAFEEQKRIRDAYLKQTHEAAKTLFEEEKFEAAINKFKEVEEAQGLNAESQALKERAVESLINSERNRAAEIFLTAKKTKDPSKKKELLNSSCDILKALIDKYPASPLNQKLKSHMAIVKEELESIQ